MSLLAGISLLLAALPAAIAASNLRHQPRAGGTPPGATLVSILIPARDEAAQLPACLAAAQASEGVAVEILVMDDGSTDDTPAIVRRAAALDERVRLLAAPPLPAGWSGKVHACARLAEAARGTHLLFIDADVWLQPRAAARLAAHAVNHDLSMVSGVPRQRLRSLGEALTVPVINLLMLGYLPGGGRAAGFAGRQGPELAAACGQLVLVEPAAYHATGGHGAAPLALHDGLAMARRLRAAGYRTEVVDGSTLAICRMYANLRDAWYGFAKNAREGMATPRALPVWTLLLAGGHLLPWLALALGGGPLAVAAIAVSLGTRGAITWHAKEPWWSVPLHPFGVVMALAIQWWSLLARRPSQWKGRAYDSGGGV